MRTERELFDELSFYTLAQPRPPFIHQIAIDTFTLQQANAATKSMALVFALIGLYLHIEKGFTGLAVQQAHTRMARERKEWPLLPLPASRGAIRVADVLGARAGPERDEQIEAWCRAEWAAWRKNRAAIAEIAARELGVR
ncbi:MAG TPA: DUF5946 family protein [Acidobacteriaceae bacterium]